MKQENLKGTVNRLTRDLEASEKRCLETKAQYMNQSKSQEAEFNQLITNLKKDNEDIFKKLTHEKVFLFDFFI